jgi:Ca-activated chloride channel family protein
VIDVVQVYRNIEYVNIEATYTFPLPVDAILLNMAVKLNDRVLVGRISERKQAEEAYEKHIEDGNSAIMLRQVEDGLFAMSVGNLMAGEDAEITLRYALPLRWIGQEMRLALPTTVAPRYGDALKAGLQPHEIPVTDMMVENPYSLTLRLLGDLAPVEFVSPSHDIECHRAEGVAEISLQNDRALADRDFVLTLRNPAERVSTGHVFTDSVSESAHNIAHFAFHVPDKAGAHHVNLKILVDCSGSMAGDSMALAKEGALFALAFLRPGDCYSISAFGSQVKHAPIADKGRLSLVPEAMMPTAGVAGDFVRYLEADMGGTEMLPALESVFAINAKTDGEHRQGGDVLLITDGEIWNRFELVQRCREAGHRIFVVGIGTSPDEAVVRGVAKATGGAAEFVSPRESIRPVIERHMHRMRVAAVSSAILHVPGKQFWTIPENLTGAVLPGDTVHVFCGFQQEREEPASLNLAYADGETLALTAHLENHVADGISPDDWSRIATAMRIKESVFEHGNVQQEMLTRLAVDYQVISPYTNYLFVHVRDEDAAKELPKLRAQPNMLAAGWGGSGSVVTGGRNIFECREIEYSMGGALQWDALDMPVVCRVRAPLGAKFCSMDTEISPSRLIETLNKTFTLINPEKCLALTLNEPYGLAGIYNPVDNAVIEGIHALIADGWTEKDALLAFWLAMLSLDISALFSRNHRRGILRAAQKTPVSSKLVQWLEETLADTTATQWSWKPKNAAPQPD